MSDNPLDRIPSLSFQLERRGIESTELVEAIDFHILDVMACLENDFDAMEDPLSYLSVVDYLDSLARAIAYLRPMPEKTKALLSEHEPTGTTRTKGKSQGATS